MPKEIHLQAADYHDAAAKAHRAAADHHDKADQVAGNLNSLRAHHASETAHRLSGEAQTKTNCNARK